MNKDTRLGAAKFCRAAALLITILAAWGCQSGPPVATQTGSRAPREGFATVQNGDGAVVDMINARFFDEHLRGDQAFTIQAGTCDLGIAYGGRKAHALQSGPTSTVKLVTFEAKPGHTYTFKTRLAIIVITFQGRHYHDDQWDVQVIDAADGSVVAETNGMQKQGGF